MSTSLAVELLAMASAVAAGAGGACLGVTWTRRHFALERKRRLRCRLGAARRHGSEGFAARIVAYAADLTQKIALGAASPLLRGLGAARSERWLAAHAGKAGIGRSVSPAGLCEAAVRLAAATSSVGAIVGASFSAELAVLGAAAGATWGASVVSRSIKRLERERAEGLERDLSEMLEVVSLGLRSGLSFDRSFDLYAAHFDSKFASACEQALRTWSYGLATRERALRELAASYDSALLARVVEGVVRSLRFGSSLAEGLELAAVEARAEHRAHVEERVAKAPVKMMVPTGALILPAMLLLVLGPVLLELMEGF